MYHSFIITTLLFLRVPLIHRSDFSIHPRRMQYLTGFSKQKKTTYLCWGNKAAFALVRFPQQGKEAQLQPFVSPAPDCSQAWGPAEVPAMGPRQPGKHRCSPKSTSLNVFYTKTEEVFVYCKIHNPKLLKWQMTRPLGLAEDWKCGWANRKLVPPGKPVSNFLFDEHFFLFLSTTRKINHHLHVIQQLSKKKQKKNSYSRSRKAILQSASLSCWRILKKQTTIHHVCKNARTHAHTLLLSLSVTHVCTSQTQK